MEEKICKPWLRLGMTLSGTALAVLLMETESKLSFALTGLLALVLMGALLWKTPLLARLFAPRRWYVWAAAAVLAVSMVYTAKSGFYGCCVGWMYKAVALLGLPRGDLITRIVPWCVGLAALPMAFGYLLWFVDTMVNFGMRFWRQSDFTERMFLLGVGSIFAMMIVFAYLCTQAFYGAHINNGWFNFDLIYSADSGYLVHQDVYRVIGAEQNDLRQPLFGVFAAPFAQCAWLISRLLVFMPNSYITVWQIVQMLLYLVALVLVGRMMKLEGAEKALFLVLMSVSYPVIIFALTAEQYLTAVFYLILLIYLEKEPVNQSLGYIAATGSLLTTGILFPLVTWDRKPKVFVKRTMLLCGAFFAVMILSGRLTTFLDVPTYIDGYGYYTGMDVSLVSKLRQYVNFAGSCLVSPPSQVDFTTYRHVSWQMTPVSGWSAMGIGVILGAAAGAWLTRESRFSKICALWMGFSLVLLGIVGWGTIDNGLMLYTLYFGWAFVAMLYGLVCKIFARWRPLKLAVIAGGIVAVGIHNVYTLREVLVFATQFFPALGG